MFLNQILHTFQIFSYNFLTNSSDSLKELHWINFYEQVFSGEDKMIRKFMGKSFVVEIYWATELNFMHR